MKHFVIISAHLFSLLFSPLLSAETLRFTSIDYCPFTCDPLKEDGKEGIMADVVRAAFEEAGYNIEIEIMPYARAVAAVNIGAVDGTLVVGKNYAPKLVYPKIPTLSQRLMFMVKPTNSWRYTDYNSLSQINLTMLVVKGFDYADDNINQYVAAKHKHLLPLQGTQPIKRGFELLSLGRVDSYAEGELTALYHINKYGFGHNFISAGFSERTFQNYSGFYPNSVDALKYSQLLSDKIVQLKQSGELDVILKKYRVTTSIALGELIGD